MRARLRRRCSRGATCTGGWWGIGSTLKPHRKGRIKLFVDGAGLPSPGRWRIANRRLPGDKVAQGIRNILREGLRVAALGAR